MDIRPLKTEADHTKAVAEIETLMDAKPGSRAFDRLEALARLVDAYEAKAHPIEASDPVDAILFHLEQLGDPRIETADYIDVSSRLEELGCPKLEDHAIGILPVGFDTLTTTDRFAISDRTRTLVKLFKENEIPVSIAKREGQPLGRRKTASLESTTWIGPTLYISAVLLSESPQNISLGLHLIADHLADFFAGTSPRGRKATLEVVFGKRENEDGTENYKKISYKGDREMLAELSEILDRACAERENGSSA